MDVVTSDDRGRVDLAHGSRTDVGRVRQVNEDAFLVAPPVFVVADGMGGHDGGDVASRVVVEEFERLAAAGYDPARGTEAVAATLAECQRRVSAYGAERVATGRARAHAGTTVAAALLVTGPDGEPGWLLVNLGDSRIYRLTDGRLDQVSVDHSVVQQLVDAGRITPEEAARHPERHVITKALGGPDAAEADYFTLPLAGAERLLLCSDGVNGMIGDAEIHEVLRDVADAQDAADELVRRALEAGGQDNATAVVVDVHGTLP